MHVRSLVDLRAHKIKELENVMDDDVVL